jgi:16S rRNA (guanine966-N2)-methyltransferase
MKITSGEFAGIPLLAPKNQDTRPTLAKTRQAVFNMLRQRLPGAVCVDLFCGTGAYGYEALSNGAKSAYFIDRGNRDLIEKNAQKLRLDSARFEILTGDYIKCLAALKKKGVKADVVFADPPYNKGLATNLLKISGINDILNEGAVLVLEAHRDEMQEISRVLQGWELYKEKKYGDTIILLIKEGRR